MGLLKALFGKKKQPEPATNRQTTTPAKKEPEISFKVEVRSTSPTPSAMPANSPSTKIQSVILVALAEKYKVGEKKYPEYFRSRYGIGFPNELFSKLEKDGFIKPASASDSLPHLKLPELKEIATQYGIKTSGKKDELCQRIIEQVPEAELGKHVPDRYWVVTDAGKELLKKNPHVTYYLEKHKYTLDTIGLDINAIDKLFSNKPNGRVRDVIWGELNRKCLECFKNEIPKGKFYNYCEILHTQALFLEEEKRYKDALKTYVRYLHYRANFQAALDAINQYSYSKDIDEAADSLYMRAEIYPFIATEIMSINEGCEFDSTQLKAFILEVLQGENDTGIFTPEELTEFIMFGLNGNEDGQKQLCKKAMKAASKKIPQR